MSNTDSTRVPLVSVITIVKNGYPQIEDTINSVFSQDYPSIEYIIKDGESIDGTLDLVKKYIDRSLILISKSDSGISDAWNQAINLASGEYIALLNCDDQWPSDFVRTAINTIMDTNADLVYGDTRLVDAQGRQRLVTGIWSRFMLWKGIGFLHPSVIASRESYVRMGSFRSDLTLAMDTDWIIRLHNLGGKFAKHKGIALMSNGGLSNRNWKAARLEYLKVLKENNIPIWTYFLGYVWYCFLIIKKELN